MIIIFLGPPGAGKGTQAHLLAKKYQLPHYSIGQLLRKEYEAGTKLGKEGEKYWGQKGLNVPTRISFAILRQYLDDKESYILDNFPRTQENLVVLRNYLRKKGLKIDFVFHLSLDRKEIEERLLKRAKIDEKITGKKRLDERLDLISTRLAIGYSQDIKKVLAYFKNLGVLYNIQGQAEILDIHHQIIEALEKSVKRRS